MVEKRRTEVSVSGTASARVLGDALTSTESEKKTATSLIFTETTSTAQNDAIIEVWLESEQLMTFDIRHSLQTAVSATRQYPTVIDLGIEIPVGQTLKVGHTSGTTASDLTYNVEYEIA